MRPNALAILQLRHSNYSITDSSNLVSPNTAGQAPQRQPQGPGQGPSRDLCVGGQADGPGHPRFGAQCSGDGSDGGRYEQSFTDSSRSERKISSWTVNAPMWLKRIHHHPDPQTTEVQLLLSKAVNNLNNVTKALLTVADELDNVSQAKIEEHPDDYI